MYLFCFLNASLILAVAALPRKQLFSGDGTYYNAGLGSCGVVSHDNQLIVALNAPQMLNGANPNVNKRCGTSIRVKGPKGSVTVKIVSGCSTELCNVKCLTFLVIQHRLTLAQHVGMVVLIFPLQHSNILLI
jgi:hypothetical protein